jgi:Ca-activated chloride channel family protein
MMGYDRIDQLKKALVNFISQLRPTDIVSIVVFDDEAVVAVPAQKLGDKKSVIDIIYAIQADGGTVIYDGMVKGFAEVSKNLAGNYMNRVVLLTDGYDSYPPEEVVAKAKENIKKGIELSTIGVGMDYNQALLAQLASAGGGMLHFAGDMKGMDEAFQKEMESILYPMAKKAQLSLFYNDQLVYKQLFGYENEVVKPGNMQVKIDHLFPGLNQMALVKFDLINATQSIEKQPVKVQLKYTDAVTEKEVILEKSIPLEWTTATGNLDMTIDKSHKQMMAVAIVNQSLKNMANAYELGNETEAQNAIVSAKKQLKSLFPTATPHQLLALTTRLDEYVKAFETLKSMRTHK